MRTFLTRLLASLAILAMAAPFLAPSATAAPLPTSTEATCGTWVLQQVSSVGELNAKAAEIDTALAKPGVVGLSVRAPWKSVDTDLTIYERALQLSTARGKALSIRFMAGRHTPARVFTAGAWSYTLPSGEKVPKPFSDSGVAGNPVFEQELSAYVAKLAAWSRANGVRLLHLPWYGEQWAEINNGANVAAAKGYSFAAWLAGHKKLIELGVAQADDTLAVEFALSGHWGANAEGHGLLADHVVATAGAWSPKAFVQGNGLGVYNSASTNRSINKAKQMYDGTDYDWTQIYSLLRQHNDAYVEVYLSSFGTARKALLATEIERFGTEKCGPATPPPPAPLSVTMTGLTGGGTVGGVASVALQSQNGTGALRLELLVDGAVTAGAAGPAATISWDTTVAANGAHTVQARAIDAAGATALSGSVAMKVDNSPRADTVAPTAPSGVTVQAWKVKAWVQWKASTDNVAVTAYRVSVDDKVVATLAASARYVVQNLTAGTSRRFGVSAVDAAGNVSATTTVTARTLA